MHKSFLALLCVALIAGFFGNVPVHAQVLDTTPPTTPTGLTRISSVSPKTAAFTWNSATDTTAVVGYDIQIDNGAFVPIGNTTVYTTPILSNGTHTFSVRARDEAGNVSGNASIAFVINGPSEHPPFTLDRMESDAELIMRGNRTDLLEALGRTSCEQSEAAAQARVIALFGNVQAQVQSNITLFMACGTPTTRHLGAGERLGIVNSYRSALGRLPSTQAHWFDVIKIGNGRFPGETSATAEANARVRFRVVYGRNPNMGVTGDANALTVMAYGLRPLPRNLNSERSAISTFIFTFRVTPSSAIEWDTVRAIAYSGATR